MYVERFSSTLRCKYTKMSIMQKNLISFYIMVLNKPPEKLGGAQNKSKTTLKKKSKNVLQLIPSILIQC